MEDKRLKIVGGTAGIGDEKLRLWLESFIAEHQHLPTTVLSRSDHIGVSRTALDAYLEGVYFLPKSAGGHGVNPKNSKIERQIRAYRNEVEGTLRAGGKSKFLKTRAWQQFQHACKTAIEENAIVVVYATPGAGKSRALKEYGLKKTTTRPISVLCSANVTTKYFAQKIAKELAIDERLSTAQLEDRIADRLKKNPRPIFIDQANYLNEKGLGTICYIWEKAQIPIVLIGTKDLYDMFNSSRLTQDVRLQLSSRIAMHYPLLTLSVEEVTSIVRKALGKDVSNETITRIFNTTAGIHRHVDMILPRMIELTNTNRELIEAGKISMDDIVDKAGARLMVG